MYLNLINQLVIKKKTTTTTNIWINKQTKKERKFPMYTCESDKTNY